MPPAGYLNISRIALVVNSLMKLKHPNDEGVPLVKIYMVLRYIS
jgi:hypothetical protein